MTDRPIIFSGPMVRALIDGRKTQTRRALKPRRGLTLGELIRDGIKTDDGAQCARHQVQEPPYAPGDRLWVREAWRPQVDPALWYCVEYKVDGARIKPHIADDEWGAKFEGWCDDVDPDWKDRGFEGLPKAARWRQSMFMPRWASRLTLTVTDVRVQRLQEISEDDAIAEGIKPHGGLFSGSGSQSDIWMTPINSFHSLWNSIHGPDAWDANPWVCAVTFTVERRNIDQ